MKIVLVSKCSLDIEQYVEFKMSVSISPSKSLISSRWVTNMMNSVQKFVFYLAVFLLANFRIAIHMVSLTFSKKSICCLMLSCLQNVCPIRTSLNAYKCKISKFHLTWAAVRTVALTFIHSFNFTYKPWEAHLNTRLFFHGVIDIHVIHTKIKKKLCTYCEIVLQNMKSVDKTDIY